MADNNASANSDDSAKKTGGSPWDDDVDLPQEDESRGKPKIIGSFDPEYQAEEKPVPFNIPEEVLEDKVGKKISASEVMGDTKPQYYTPSTDQTRLGDAKLANPAPTPVPVPPAASSAPSTSNEFLTASTTAPAQANQLSAKPTSNSQTVKSSTNNKPGGSPATSQPSKGFASSQPSLNVKPALTNAPGQGNPTKFQQITADQRPVTGQASPGNSKVQGGGEGRNGKSDIRSKSQPLTSSVSAGPRGDQITKPQSSANNFSVRSNPPSVPEKAKSDSLDASRPEKKPESTESAKQEGGIFELIKPKESSAPVNPKPASQNAPLQATSAGAPAPSQGISTSGKPQDLKKAAVSPFGAALPDENGTGEFRTEEAKEKPAKQPAEVVEKSNGAPKAIDMVKPAAKKIESAPQIAKEQVSALSAPEQPKAKKSLFSRLLHKSKAPLDQAVVKPADKPSVKEQLSPAGLGDRFAGASNLPERPTHSRDSAGSRLSPKLSILITVVVLLVASIYLTELGLLSIGLEKVYGTIGLEKIWGGLPNKAEPALAMSMTKTQQNLSFKFKGTINTTIDTTKKSAVSGPLALYSHNPFRLADVNAGARDSATLTQYDYYGTNTSSGTSSDSSASSSSTSSSSDTTGDVSSPTTATSSDATSSQDQATQPSYSATESTVKQEEFDITGLSTDDALSSDIDLKSLVGADKKINLMSSSGNLYVKSDQIKFDDKAVAGKWLEYSFPGFATGNSLKDFFNIKSNSGMSVTGSRVGDELVGGSRAYRYKIDSLEIGDAFAELGIPKEAINSISGDVWLGVHDHLIKKASLDISPSVAASFTKITVELEFYDYNVENSITLPALDDVTAIQSTAPETATTPAGSNTPAVTTPESTAPSQVTSSARVANDAARDADLKQIKAALTKYKQSKGRYPISRNFENINLRSSVLANALVPGYIAAVPTDPKVSAGWWYGYKSDGKSFTLSARFENIDDTEVTKSGDVYLHYVWGN